MPAARPRPRCLRGFTLVEVAAATAVVGVLAATVLPGFQSQLLRSHRAQATQALQLAQGAQETHRSQHGRYAEALAELKQPDHTRNQRYQIELHTQDPSSYTLVARAVGAQAKDTACAEISVRVRGAISHHEPRTGCWPT